MINKALDKLWKACEMEGMKKYKLVGPEWEGSYTEVIATPLSERDALSYYLVRSDDEPYSLMSREDLDFLVLAEQAVLVSGTEEYL